jgi:two-component system, cell cycle response regulator
MLRRWARRVRSRTSFSTRFALILCLLGVLIAGTTAAIPVQLAASEARNVALDRAADKGGVAVNLLDAQRSALRTYILAIAGQVGAPLQSGETAAAGAIMLRQSAATDSQDVIGASFGPVLRNGVPVGSTDTEYTAMRAAVAQHADLAVDGSGTPWLVEQTPVPGVADSTVFIARPMRADFISRLDADLGGGADAASLALVHDGIYVAGATAATGTVRAGTPVPAAFRSVAERVGRAVITNVNGSDTAVSVRGLDQNVALLITTTVGNRGFMSSVVGPVAMIAVLMILLALIAVFAIVQRDLQRPLRRLDRAVAALEREDFDVPIPIDRDDELGRLGGSFERMRTTLRATLAGAEARAQIATELNAGQPLQTALQRVCTVLHSTTGARAALLAVDHSDMADAFAVTVGIESAVDAQRLLRGGGPLTAALSLDSATPLQAMALEGTEEARLGLGNLCAAPLRIGAHVLGALALADKPDTFNPADVTLVATAAEQVVLALERYRILAVAQRQASTDELTGLYNYRFLVDYLDQQIALAERLDSPLAVLMLDLDRFKTLNDSHGHHAGDEALRRFAASLRDTIRRSDLAARYGGEEFVVVMANTNREEARLVAEKIRRAVSAQRMEFDSVAVRITVSVGGVAYPDDTGDARQLLELADDALYRAKRAGRNRVCFVSDSAARRTLARAWAHGTAQVNEDDDERDTGHRPAQ